MRVRRQTAAEVATREPCAVILNSGTACRATGAGAPRYQSLATTRRQSRDNLSARFPTGFTPS